MNIAEIYLMGGRKAWHHVLPEGWTETHWERFDYVECGIYSKPASELTDEDLEYWVAHHSERPEGWIEPARLDHD